MSRFTPATLLPLWQKLQNVPGGSRLFSLVIGFAIPYSGSIGATVTTLAPGHCETRLSQRRKLSNHLNSIHAIAQANLLELTSGLALNCGLREDARSILVGIEVEYLKKARGTLCGLCRCEIPENNERRNYPLTVSLLDAQGDTVARATAHWLIGPRPE